MGRIIEKGSKDVPPAGSTRRGSSPYTAQCGEEYPSVKALQGFGGRGVLEIVAPHEGDTYRAVYTVRLRDAVYVLHAFQKKSKKGIGTPKRELELVRQRLIAAEQDHAERDRERLN
jgi:phage-related protein